MGEAVRSEDIRTSCAHGRWAQIVVTFPLEGKVTGTAPIASHPPWGEGTAVKELVAASQQIQSPAVKVGKAGGRRPLLYINHEHMHSVGRRIELEQVDGGDP